MYAAIMPPYIPNARALILISGACEILGGIGVMLPFSHVAAGWGLIALLVAVFPANLYMATEAGRFRSVAPAWALWARLPLQAVLIFWVYRACIDGG
jgi:uncharacterized membrane protein